MLTGEKVIINILSLLNSKSYSIQVAIKILEKDRIKDKKDVERITREIKILKKVRHPNVIQLYEVKPIHFLNNGDKNQNIRNLSSFQLNILLIPISSLQIIETESELYLIMEFCPNGELFDFIVAH